MTALKALDAEFEAVSASLKVPFYKTFWRVTLPICTPALVDIARYFFINAMTTISAVVFLYSPDTKVASIAILNLDEAGEIGAAAAMAVLIARRLRRRDAAVHGAGLVGQTAAPRPGERLVKMKETQRWTETSILLTPGPLTTTLRTKLAMLRDWGSWDADFNAVTARVRQQPAEDRARRGHARGRAPARQRHLQRGGGRGHRGAARRPRAGAGQRRVLQARRASWPR